MVFVFFLLSGVILTAKAFLDENPKATDPQILAAQERLASCHYAMAHPESGELVPACVQHCVLDPVENIELSRLLPIVDGPATRAT